MNTLIKINEILSSKYANYFDYLISFIIIGMSAYYFYIGDDYKIYLTFGLISLAYSIVNPLKMLRDKFDIEKIER